MIAHAPARARPAQAPRPDRSPPAVRPPEAAPARTEGRCACGGGCPRCNRHAERQDGWLSQPDDAAERQAEQTASRALAGRTPAAPAELTRPAARATMQGLPPAVRQAVAAPGQTLSPELRQEMEPRFGQDFSAVRLHTDGLAARSARSVGALAYTVGTDIVFGSGRYAPHTPAGRRLLGHELAHVAQQPPGNPAIVMRTADPAEQALYPSVSERGRVRDILDPQQQAAAAAGTAVPPVTDPAGFRTAMTSRINTYINQLLPDAQARQASSVNLSLAAVQSLGDVAQPAVQTFYGTYLTAAVHAPAEAARLSALQLRDTLHLVSERAPDVDLIACNWVASRMQDRGSDIIESHNVLANVTLAKERCSSPAAAGSSPATERDQALFESVQSDIRSARQADLATLILYQSSFETGGSAFIQSQIAPRGGESEQQTRRRGRWETLGTVLHEMLHEVAHEQFREAAGQIENVNVLREGFAEYLSRPVYNDLRRRAGNTPALRSSIEGVSEPFDDSLAPDRTGYQRYVDRVVEIRDILGANEDNLKVAYFMGRVEYLGLGGWNEAEARRREALRHPANMLGFSAMVTDNGQGLFRVDYGRVLLGRGGNLQFSLGGTFSYLTEGQRLGVGATASLRYSWPNVYIGTGLTAGASTSATQPFASSVRLDLIPGAEVGVRIGVVRIGAGVNLLIPLAGGPVSERTVRVAAGLGISGEF